jgi:polyisoprenoid-binding protein YceI
MKQILVPLLILASLSINAQEKYFTRDGHIDFYSHAPLEDIRANNDQVAAFLELATGELNFAVLMKSFEFKKALMQEHFNENYIESDEYPRAKFSGVIQEYSKIDLKKPGSYKVTVTGQLTIHGVTNGVVAPAELFVEKGRIKATSTFKVKPVEYNIKIPSAVKNNIAEEIEVNVVITLVPYTG